MFETAEKYFLQSIQ